MSFLDLIIFLLITHIAHTAIAIPPAISKVRPKEVELLEEAVESVVVVNTGSSTGAFLYIAANAGLLR
jgi:hypothetical protein